MSNALCLSPREYFQEIVDEGLTKRNLKTSPAVSLYLVDLLEHYLDAKNLYDSEINDLGQKKPQTLAEMFLQAGSADPTERRGLLKKLGDRSLYISGFFGDSLRRKSVDVDYYVEMGGAAYACLSQSTREDHAAKLYHVFSRRFQDFVDVLTYISQKSFVQSDESILRLYERYLRTGSELAREKLVEMGVVTVSRDHIKLVRQD
jgi:hypothetical protein